MNKKQLDFFQSKISSNQRAELRTMPADKKAQYILVYWTSDNFDYRLEFVFVIYDNCLIRRYEIDGCLRSYTLHALEQALKNE